MTNEELNSVMAKAKEQFKKGEPLFGKNGAFHFMLEEFLNKALDAEMDEHLAEKKVTAARTVATEKCGRLSRANMVP